MKKNKGPVIVTGAAGFIGMHVCDALLARGEHVVGFDAMTPYNDPALKKKRLALLSAHTDFLFVKGDLSKGATFKKLVEETRPRAIIHLAGQAGVRYSIESPQSYIDANVTGTLNVCEAAKTGRTPVIYASSSSVYGEREGSFKETDVTDSPVSLYAATKKSTEHIANVYAGLYQIPMVGLRFFTVYGPWMRTDLAIFKFARLLALGKEIPLYASGKGKRSYSHVSLVVGGVLAALDRVKPGHTIYNLGEEKTFTTSAMLDMLAKELNVNPKIKILPHQKGDVMYTRASSAKAKRELGLKPGMSLPKGIQEFAQWFRKNEAFLLSLKDIHS